MLRYSLRTLAWLAPALVAAHFFGYAFGHVVAPLQAARNPLSLGEIDRTPLPASYSAYLHSVVVEGFGLLPGDSAGRTIGAVVGEAALNSLGLLLIAMALSIGFGIGLGVFAVRENPPRIAPWLTGAATVGLAVPTFFFGILGVAAVVMLLIYAPGQPLLVPLEGYGWDQHLVLPVLALMLRPTAQIAQVTAGMLVAEYGRQYVVTARSLGVGERRIARRHVLRNALPAVVATIAASLRLSAGELIIVETLFYWPGLGRLIALVLIPSNASLGGESALFLNPPILGAALALFAGLFLISNAVAGVAVRALDPRVGT